MNLENVLVRSNSSGAQYIRIADIPVAYKAMLQEWVEERHTPELHVSGETSVIRATDWFTFLSQYHHGGTKNRSQIGE